MDHAQSTTVFLNADYLSILVVGGGKVVVQKIKGILPFTTRITVLAMEILPELREYPIRCIEEPYSSGFLRKSKFNLIYACTNDPTVNQQIVDDARSRKTLVNGTNDGTESDFTSCYNFHWREFAFSLSSGGMNISGSKFLKKEIQDHLENHIDLNRLNQD